MSRRIAIVPLIPILLMQATPALACIGMPGRALSACCCETDHACPMGRRATPCAVPEACCAPLVGTLAASVSAVDLDHRVVTPLGAPAGALAADSPVQFSADGAASNFMTHQATPPPAVRLYLRHLRLAL